jgi:hypothetical protein
MIGTVKLEPVKSKLHNGSLVAIQLDGKVICGIYGHIDDVYGNVFHDTGVVSVKLSELKRIVVEYDSEYEGMTIPLILSQWHEFAPLMDTKVSIKMRNGMCEILKQEYAPLEMR